MYQQTHYQLVTLFKKHIHYNTIFLTSLTIVAATLPFSLLLNSISIILLSFIWLPGILYFNRIKLNPPNLYFFFPVAFYLMHIIGLYSTDNIKEGFFELEKKMSLIVFPLILGTSYKLDQNQVNTILKAFLFSVFISSLICLGYAVHRNNYLDTFFHPNWFFFSYTDLTEIIGIQPNYLALYVSFCILTLFHFFMKNRKNYSALKQVAFISVILYHVFFLLLLSCRTPIIAVVIIVVSGMVYHFYKKKKLWNGFFLMIGVGLILMAGVYHLPIVKERLWATFGIKQKTSWIDKYGGGVEGMVPNVRLFKWKCAWNAIEENWITGVGTGDSQDALQVQYKAANFTMAFDARYNAHNQYLDTWLEIGIMGLLIYLACLIVPAFNAWKKKQYLFLSFIILFSVCCFTESMLSRQNGIVFYTFFYSVFAFHSLKQK